MTTRKRSVRVLETREEVCVNSRPEPRQPATCVAGARAEMGSQGKTAHLGGPDLTPFELPEFSQEMDRVQRSRGVELWRTVGGTLRQSSPKHPDIRSRRGGGLSGRVIVAWDG